MVKIERTKPRPGTPEIPWRDAEGRLQLASPALPAKHRNRVAFATFRCTIEEAAALVEAGFALRMGAHGKRASLISPASLRVTR